MLRSNNGLNAYTVSPFNPVTLSMFMLDADSANVKSTITSLNSSLSKTYSGVFIDFSLQATKRSTANMYLNLITKQMY